jgi:hypothetical protein
MWISLAHYEALLKQNQELHNRLMAVYAPVALKQVATVQTFGQTTPTPPPPPPAPPLHKPGQIVMETP